MRSAEIRKIIAGIQEIPTLPAVATRILELTSEDAPSAAALTSVIQSDQAMAAKILKLANSPFYGSRGNVTTLPRAISVLGLRMVRNTALSLSVFDLFKKDKHGNERKLFHLTDFWRHSAAVAIASELLARHFGYPAPDEAFVAGLIHDIGKVIFYTNATEEFNMVLEDVRQSRRTLLDAEEDLIGIGHTQVGRLLTEKWGLPQVLIEAIWLHHQPIRIEPKGLPNLPSIIRLADSLCLINHIGASGNTSSSVFHSPIFTSMNMDERTADQIAKEVLVRLEDVGELFGLETCSVDMYLSAVRRANAELGRLNMELEHHNRELNVRRKALDATKGLFKEITPHILPNEAVKLICAASLATFDCKRAMCFYLDEQDEQVYGTVASKGEEREIAWPIKGGVLAPVSSELSSEAVNLIEASLLGASDGYQVGDEVLRTIQSSTLMATPLVAHSKVLGQLIIDLEGSNTPVGLSKLALENLAVVAASTLERAILFESSSSQTETLARMNRQIEEAQQQLLHSERLASIGTLAAGAAHEINNPLAVISAKAQIMQRKTKDPEQQDGYRIIIEQTKRIAKIIGDLMGFARPTDPKMEQVIIQAVVERSLSLVENRIALADISVSIDFPENLPLVMGDSNQLDQVFLNLFVNAQQAMAKGGEIQIKGRQSEDGKSIEVRFTDTGRGIPQKNLQRIFDPFFTTKKQGEGTGLGLAVSHRIIEAHGGQMNVESRVGDGTTFVILLPISQSAQIKQIQSELLKSTIRSPMKGRDQKQRILIIDDEDLIRETLEMALVDEGFTVECARDGLEGLQKIVDGTFDLALLDIRMPHRDGMDVLEGIKENLRKFPVIIITGLAAEKEIQECIEAGAFDCIRKPFEVSEVLSSVRKALREFRKRQSAAGQRA